MTTRRIKWKDLQVGECYAVESDSDQRVRKKIDKRTGVHPDFDERVHDYTYVIALPCSADKGQSLHHSTRKKSPVQLDREIAAAIAEAKLAEIARTRRPTPEETAEALAAYARAAQAKNSSRKKPRAPRRR